MIKLLFISLAVFLVGCETDYSKFEKRVPHDYLAEYTTDIIVGRYVEFKEVRVPGETCIYHQEKIEVLEAVKGSMVKGDVVTINGLSAHENSVEGSDHLLFLAPSKVEKENSNNPCLVELHRNSFSSLIWCCAISEDGVVMYDMVNSEEKGENYYLSTKKILGGLREQVREGNL